MLAGAVRERSQEKPGFIIVDQANLALILAPLLETNTIEEGRGRTSFGATLCLGIALSQQALQGEAECNGIL